MNLCNLATELRFLSKKYCQDTLTFSKMYLLAPSISKHTSGFLSVIQTSKVAMNSRKTIVKVLEIVLILKKGSLTLSVAETNFAARKTKNVFAWSQKHFCFPDTNFASETYVSQFSHPGKHNKKHCSRNNVSQFSQAFTSMYINVQ